MILTIDQGTTSSRALIISESGEIISLAQKEFKQIYPEPGWVEHDPVEIWQTTMDVCRDAIQKSLSGDNYFKQKISAENITGIAITNQRETTILWDKRTGKPIYNAIVWQCRRTANFCRNLRAETHIGESMYLGFKEYVRKTTGLYIDSYFSGPKIAWILDKENHLNFGQADANIDPINSKSYGDWPSVKDIGVENILFGTVDTWILWNLTQGQSHFTEPSNASRTMLFNIVDGVWDRKILNILKIPENILPKVIPSNSSFGTCSLFKDLLERDLEIKAILGDQQAAWYAHHEAPKITYGTGSFIVLPANYQESKQSHKTLLSKFKFDKKIIEAPMIDGLLTSVGYEMIQSKASKNSHKHYDQQGAKKDNLNTQKSYIYEGSIFIAGAIVQWLRDEMGFIQKSSDIEALANSVKDNGGVYLIPALVGLGAPHWREDLCGAIFGISRGTNKAHIARAALESIAYSVKDVFVQLDIENNNKNSFKIDYINVDGGASKNDMLMQFQADLLGISIHRMKEAEMTALGVARMTGEVEFKLKAEKIFSPANDVSKHYLIWSEYLQKLL